MKNEHDVVDIKKLEGHGTLTTYVIGFVLSIVLTLAAYFLVTEHVLAGGALVLAISGLATLQALVQLIFFLHLGTESNPPWNLLVFLFMLSTAAILVIGSLWIMYSLDYRMT